MTTKNYTYLKNYQQPEIIIRKVDLDFDLAEEYVIVKQTTDYTLNNKTEILLDGYKLDLLMVKINDNIWPDHLINCTETHLKISDCPLDGKLVIITKIYPNKNTELLGLYEVNGLFCTQCEAEGFRRITYFPDRPDVMTFFTTTIHADKKSHPILLSNGNLISSGDEDNDRHYAIWQDPYKKPCYLFALVAGNLACQTDSFLTKSGRKVELQCYVNPGQENLCDHALESLKKAMRWDEDTYLREYDLDRYMIVAIHEFNMGAMENKGLNIFNAQFVLAHSEYTTDSEFNDIESVVAHEYFHNWTGNRITCRDWFQLSLKEGLTIFRDQEFSRDLHCRELARIHDVKRLIVSQFPEDRGSMAHPVRPTEYQNIDNFYTATVYNKGAEIIRMLETLLGIEKFRTGMQKYFALFDGQAVTIEDFIYAMEIANNINLTNFKEWYNQVGTPKIKIENTLLKNGSYDITISQSNIHPIKNYEQKELEIPIKISLFTESGSKINDQPEVIVLKNKKQTFSFKNIKFKPLVSYLRDFSAPVIIEQDYCEQDLITILMYENNGYAKWNASRQLVNTSIIDNYQDPNKFSYNQKLLEAFEFILLDNQLDPELKAELLTPPSLEEITPNLEKINITQLEKSRLNFKRILGNYLLKAAETTYLDTASYDSKNRALKNACLSLLIWGDQEKFSNTALMQLQNNKNMTLKLAAYYLLSQTANLDLKAEAHDYFYQLTLNNELLYNKWLAAHAMDNSTNAIENITSIIKHERFSYTKPNQVRALIGGFCSNNPLNLHRSDGKGYLFLKEQLVLIDKINPHVAARMATTFSRWQHLDNPRQEIIKVIIKDLLNMRISNNLREIIYLRD